MLKIGLDIHGVADENIEFFRELATVLIAAGHEVHIITGPHSPKAVVELDELKMPYTHLFSIADYHAAKGTKMTYGKAGNPFMEDYDWDRTKADYCLEHGIQLHLDDSDAYGYFFKTPYARYFSKNKRKHYLKDQK